MSNSQIRLIKLADLKNGKMCRHEFNGKAYLLCRVDDEVFALDDRCTHEDVSLSLGALCEHRVRCPLHGSEFDIRTGEVLDEPADVDLKTHAVVIEEGWVYLNELPS